jgi:hypothetical protein
MAAIRVPMFWRLSHSCDRWSRVRIFYFLFFFLFSSSLRFPSCLGREEINAGNDRETRLHEEVGGWGESKEVAWRWQAHSLT